MLTFYGASERTPYAEVRIFFKKFALFYNKLSFEFVFSEALDLNPLYGSGISKAKALPKCAWKFVYFRSKCKGATVAELYIGSFQNALHFSQNCALTYARITSLKILNYYQLPR